MSFGGATIGQAIGSFVGGVVVLALIAAYVVHRGRKKGSTTIALDVTLTLSSWAVVLGGVSLFLAVGLAFGSSEMTFTTSQLSLPAERGLPCDGADLGGTGSVTTLTCLTPQSASVSIEYPTLESRWLTALGAIATHIAVLAPIAAVALISFQAIRGVPFTRLVTRALYVTAGVVFVAGTAGALLAPIAELVALRNALPVDDPLLRSGVLLTFPLLPACVAILCLGFAAIVRHGARIQRDTEGLV